MQRKIHAALAHAAKFHEQVEVWDDMDEVQDVDRPRLDFVEKKAAFLSTGLYKGARTWKTLSAKCGRWRIMEEKLNNTSFDTHHESDDVV